MKYSESVHVVANLPTYADVLAAAERIRPYIHRTPVFTSATLDRMTGATLYFKDEALQKK